MNSLFKKTLALVLAIVMLFSLCACGGSSQSSPSSTSKAVLSADGGSWTIAIYMCGSDLEGEYGFASWDLEEISCVELPENAKVVIQTGGSSHWDGVPDAGIVPSSNALQRWEYSGSSFSLLDTLPQGNMSDRTTLESFLSFIKSDYPADHNMLVFWDHGGGPLYGVCFDMNADANMSDSLSLNDISKALASVYGNSPNKAFDIIGFDACLMNSIEVLSMLSPYADYAVASQEVEPALGWYYTGFLGALARNPKISAEALGIAACDAYFEDLETYDLADNATLALLDLRNIGLLQGAFSEFNKEILSGALDSAAFKARFGQTVEKSSSYSKSGGSDLLDLGDLARRLSGKVSSAEALLRAIDDCVVYKREGKYKSDASGMSCFYPFGYSEWECGAYRDCAAFDTSEVTDSLLYLYNYCLFDSVNDNVWNYLNIAPHELPVPYYVSMIEPENLILQLTENGYFFNQFFPEEMNAIIDARLQVFYQIKNGGVAWLGETNYYSREDDQCRFYDDYFGRWYAFNNDFNNVAFVRVTYIGDTYETFEVPVNINGEGYYIIINHDFDTDSYLISGARELGTEDGAESRLYQLQDGDVIEIANAVSSNLKESNYKFDLQETIVFDSSTCFGEVNLPEGTYYLRMKYTDFHGDSVYSDYGKDVLKDGVLVADLMDTGVAVSSNPYVFAASGSDVKVEIPQDAGWTMFDYEELMDYSRLDPGITEEDLVAYVYEEGGEVYEFFGFSPNSNEAIASCFLYLDPGYGYDEQGLADLIMDNPNLFYAFTDMVAEKVNAEMYELTINGRDGKPLTIHPDVWIEATDAEGNTLYYQIVVVYDQSTGLCQLYFVISGCDTDTTDNLIQYFSGYETY